jgi:hypothetical protein
MPVPEVAVPAMHAAAPQGQSEAAQAQVAVEPQLAGIAAHP